MTPERWQQLKDIFAAAEELPPSECAAFLDRACTGDPELRAEAEVLLRREQAPSFLDQPAIQLLGSQQGVGQPGIIPADTPITKECPTCFLCFDDAVDVCPNDGTPLAVAFLGNCLIDGKYRVQRCLGRGGMGKVYLAYHIGLDKYFALKLILTPAANYRSFLTRFQIEAKALGKLKHPGIVDVTDYGVDPRGLGLPYLVMEYLEGVTLSGFSPTVGTLPVEQSLAFLKLMAEAIDYAHESGVLHCDLKPANIFLPVTEPGERRAVKIVDFGLAQMTSESWESSIAVAAPGTTVPISSRQFQASDEVRHGPRITNSAPRTADSETEPASLSGMLMGTPAYMAPELFRGQPASPATDLYSLGVIAYELLTGRLPFNGRLEPWCDSGPFSSAQCVAPSQVNCALPHELDAPVLRLLNRDPKGRPCCSVEGVAAISSAWSLAGRRLWWTREIPRRLFWTAPATVFLLLAAVLLGDAGPVQEWELRTVDARFAVHARKPPDPRILVVSVDEASLAADATPLAERADEFGIRLEQVFAAGARAVALDFLLPSYWSQSPSFSRLVLDHRDRLTLALFSSPSGQTVGAECLTGLTAAALGPEAVSSLFGFVNLEADADGLTRRTRLFYRDELNRWRQTWAARAAQPLVSLASAPHKKDLSNTSFWIDYTLNWKQMPRIAWKDLPTKLERDPGLVRNRLVLVGGEFAGSGDEYYRVPSGSSEGEILSGLMIQSLIANTITAGLPVQEARPATCILSLGVLVGVLLTGSLCLPRHLWVAALFATLTCFYSVAAVFWFLHAQIIVPIAMPLLTLALSVGLGAWLRSLLPTFPSEKAM